MNAIDFDGMNTRCFEYGNLRIAVRSHDEASLVWLEEFSCPAFRPIDCDHPDWTVTLERDSPLYGALIQRLPLTNPDSVDFFTLDGSFQQHELLESDGHIFRNAMLIVIAGFPSAFISILFAGSIFIEILFSLDGMGLLGYEA